MIRSYRDKLTESVASGRAAKGFPADLVRSAVRRLTLLDNAAALSDLRSPPGNRLEALAGDRKGQFSIRINDQYRICFEWTDAGPVNVEIADYHP
ncbi:Killer protein [Kaistia algarum]|uniref:type II toxin-antitoxin system RelE/ParE family toxin n=1 Tax=Kaistia algarum TaxID=2083279 RepID=UPI000CE7771F|nr:type II toxin-antitoxin system RelE/ParE family toxin [Kaistia algarum]MCX5512138.1 type II toxin-antitoxin system RelE/ParE family toxin [Kaistia algarum]PPE80246.1 Killer protein [Kaistia algarum]